MSFLSKISSPPRFLASWSCKWDSYLVIWCITLPCTLVSSSINCLLCTGVGSIGSCLSCICQKCNIDVRYNVNWLWLNDFRFWDNNFISCFSRGSNPNREYVGTISWISNSWLESFCVGLLLSKECFTSNYFIVRLIGFVRVSSDTKDDVLRATFDKVVDICICCKWNLLLWNTLCNQWWSKRWIEIDRRVNENDTWRNEVCFNIESG